MKLALLTLLSALYFASSTPPTTTPAVHSSPSPSQSGSHPSVLDSLDAKTPSALNALIAQIHQQFLAKTPTAGSSNTRPVYASPDVVNAAYRTRNNQAADYQACKDDVFEAIFSTPPGCMIPLVPGHLPIHVGIERGLAKRDALPCVYTSVRCVSNANFGKDPIDLARRIKAEQQPRRAGSEIWFQRKLFANTATVNAAYRLSVVDVPVKGNVCGKPEGAELDTGLGSLMAVFPQDPVCRQTGGKKSATGAHCRDIMVECI